MAIRSTVLVIADTVAELEQVLTSAPVALCMETERLVFRRNGGWHEENGGANLPTHTHGQNQIPSLVSDLAGKCANDDPRLSNARSPLAHTHSVSDISGLSKTSVGLPNVDNTADSAKPISSAMAAALAAKQDTLASLIEAPDTQRIFCSPLPSTAGFLLVSGLGYFVYLGKTLQPVTPKFVEFHVSTAGAGTQTAEVGLFSSPTPPNKTALTLTKLIATATVDSLTSTGVKRNTAGFNQQIAAGVHLWAAIRTTLATTQPTIWGLGLDMGQGQVQSKSAAGALTAISSTTAALIAAATGMVAPNLRVAMD